MRWEDGQVHMTSLETREANVQKCNSVKSVCNSTEREQTEAREGGAEGVEGAKEEEEKEKVEKYGKVKEKAPCSPRGGTR